MLKSKRVFIWRHSAQPVFMAQQQTATMQVQPSLLDTAY